MRLRQGLSVLDPISRLENLRRVLTTYSHRAASRLRLRSTNRSTSGLCGDYAQSNHIVCFLALPNNGVETADEARTPAAEEATAGAGPFPGARPRPGRADRLARRP